MNCARTDILNWHTRYGFKLKYEITFRWTISAQHTVCHIQVYILLFFFSHFRQCKISPDDLPLNADEPFGRSIQANAGKHNMGTGNFIFGNSFSLAHKNRIKIYKFFFFFWYVKRGKRAYNLELFRHPFSVNLTPFMSTDFPLIHFHFSCVLKWQLLVPLSETSIFRS